MSSSSKKVILTSLDGEKFEVYEDVASESQIIKHMIEDDCADNGIPLPNVTGKILAKVIEYCKRHVEAAAEDDKSFAPTPEEVDINKWDAEFVKVDQDTLFDLMLAANYLDITSLVDLTCKTVADMMRDRSVEENRLIFNIKNDYTPEEEAAVRKENEWAFK